MTLSTPVKIVALAGLALALAGGGMLFLFGSHSKSPAVAAPPKTQAPIQVVQIHSSKPAKPAKPKLALDASLPLPLFHALQQSREVVAFVYSPASATDRMLLAEAKAGAKLAGVGFVALNVENEQVADDVYFWASGSSDPETFVVKRPGTIAWSLAGTIDRGAVAQAAAK